MVATLTKPTQTETKPPSEALIDIIAKELRRQAAFIDQIQDLRGFMVIVNLNKGKPQVVLRPETVSS